MRAAHNNFIPGLQPVQSQPGVAVGRAQSDGAPFGLKGVALAGHGHEHEGCAPLVAQHGPLRHEQRIPFGAHVHHGPHKHSGQKFAGRVGKFGPDGNGSGALIHAHVRETQGTGFGIGAAVAENQVDLGFDRFRPKLIAVPHAQLLAQDAHFIHGLSKVHIHGHGLVDGGQSGGLVHRDQRAHGHRGFADAPADGSPDLSALKIDFGRTQRSLAGGHFGLGLEIGGVGVVIVLEDHRIGL